MKKLILSLALVISAGFYLGAQDLYLTMDGVKIGDTVTVEGDAALNEFLFHANFHNDSPKDMNVMVIRKRLFLVEGASSLFCWGLCYGPDTDTSGQYVFIPSGGQSVDDAFSGHYIPNSKEGTSMVEYTFYNLANSFENVRVVCKYKAELTGIAEDAMKGGFLSDVYPNPATNSVNIDFQFTSKVKEAKVRVINLMGAVVKEAVVEPGTSKLNLDVSNLNNGLYFYSVIINGDVYQTKKMVIQK